jgi:hypothetical protein
MEFGSDFIFLTTYEAVPRIAPFQKIQGLPETSEPRQRRGLVSSRWLAVVLGVKSKPQLKRNIDYLCRPGAPRK